MIGNFKNAGRTWCKEADRVLVHDWPQDAIGKTVTSRLLRRDFGEELDHFYSKPVLWSRSYFVASCGGAPLPVIKQYIEQQARPD